ncbi:MAG TPA: hypothetical protein VK850_14190 [Candidatus Binatia bacterium]|nr:hypothetical protein [Candidatus Binatia bacterium]
MTGLEETSFTGQPDAGAPRREMIGNQNHNPGFASIVIRNMRPNHLE